MSQSMANVTLHLVFSTSHRKALLRPPELREQLYAYMATILADNVESPAICIGGTDDHVHALVNLSRNYAIKDVIKEAKTETSKWLKRQARALDRFAWQRGYGAFSVSQSKVPQVRRYIQNQFEHHRTLTFQEEFRELCRRHGLMLDERYVWE